MADHARHDGSWRRRDRAWLPALLACSAIGLTSCGTGRPRTVPVSGRVSFDDGSPVGGAGVELAIEVKGRRFNSRGVADADGRFTLGTFREADGALPGEHAAIVVGPSAYTGGNVTKLQAIGQVPERYGAYATSGLTVIVPESGGAVAIRVEQR